MSSTKVASGNSHGAGVRDRLDRMVVGVERAREKAPFAVSRGAHGIDRKRDFPLSPQRFFKLTRPCWATPSGLPLLDAWERIDKLTRLIDQGELGRRAPRIDTERHTHRLSGRIRIRTLAGVSLPWRAKIRLLGRVWQKGWARRPSSLAGATVSSLSSRTKAPGRSIGWDDANMSVSDRAAPRATMICGSRGTIT